MRITFVVMGWENIAVEYLSSYLKLRGHEVSLAYDQCLFDDKNYLFMPRIARMFDQGDNVLKQVVDSRPDVVAFSVMVFYFQWALKRAAEVKELLNVPTVFGGSHAICCPERMIGKDAVDIVCPGEGEMALADLLDSMEGGSTDTSIAGLWFKREDGTVIQNPRRAMIPDLDAMPFPDKDLFAPVVPIRNYYLAVTNRGCPFMCTYCAAHHFSTVDKDTENFARVRCRSVDNVIEELKVNLHKYNYKWVDFRNPVFSPSRPWVLEFCEKYTREINRPFRVFGHPLLIKQDTTEALRDAGCFAIQIGLESYDERIRNQLFNRQETNEQIDEAYDILEKAKARFSLDYILDVPGQTDEELVAVAKLFSRLKHCYRVSPFMLSYLPKVPLLDHAVKKGILSESDIPNIEDGLHGNYMNKGSKVDQKRYKTMTTFKLYLRSLSFMPTWMRKLSTRFKVYHLFRYLPLGPVLAMFDVTMVLRDHDARAYALNYWWWFKKRFDRSSPNYFRKRLTSQDKVARRQTRPRLLQQSEASAAAITHSSGCGSPSEGGLITLQVPPTPIANTSPELVTADTGDKA